MEKEHIRSIYYFKKKEEEKPLGKKNDTLIKLLEKDLLYKLSNKSNINLSKSMNQVIKPSRRAIIVTAIEKELNVIDSFFTTVTEHHPQTNKAYKRGIVEMREIKWDIMLVATGKYNDESAAETALLINHHNPEIAFFIGTAGRLDSTLNIGDIIIPPVVVGYNYGKDNKGKFQISFKNVKSPSPKLIEYAVAITRDEDFMKGLRKSKRNFPKSDFKIILDEDKYIASGNVTVHDSESETAKMIRKMFPEAVAVDMEGIGFLKACTKFNVQYLLIRSISDFLKGKKKMNMLGSRELAIEKATKVALEILSKISHSLE